MSDVCPPNEGCQTHRENLKGDAKISNRNDQIIYPHGEV